MSRLHHGIRRFGVLILLGYCAEVAAATTLRVDFVDEAGVKVRPDSAELLLVAWGEARRLALQLENGNLQLPMDTDWLRSRWPERFADLEKVYLLFRAEGFVTLRSEPFQWIGAPARSDGTATPSALIGLPPRLQVHVDEGQSVQMRVVMRRPQPRSLVIQDPAGRPIEGVEVGMGMFWSSSNHCGVLSGNDALGRARSDRDGRVRVPDGDFEYAFEFSKPRYLLAGAQFNSIDAERLVTKLDAGERVVTMRQLERRPLILRVTANGAPVAERQLMGSLAACGCGTCSGPLAVTDAGGEIRIAEFFPEQYGAIWFEDDNGQTIWRRDVGKLDLGTPVRAELAGP